MSADIGRFGVEAAIDGVETVSFENVQETAEVERVIGRLINSGHNSEEGQGG